MNPATDAEGSAPRSPEIAVASCCRVGCPPVLLFLEEGAEVVRARASIVGGGRGGEAM